jgi:hypothetical protein
VAQQPPVTVTISPTQASVQVGRQLRFSATVQGSTNQTVTWEVNGIVGGNKTVGTISTTGLYTAPTSTGSVVITVVSNVSPSASARAAVSIVRRR